MGSPTINRTSFLCEFLVMRLFKYVHEEDMRYIWGGGGCNRNEMLYHGISNSYLQLYSIEFTWLINWVWCNINGSVWFMVFNATFNNISVLSWRSLAHFITWCCTEYTSSWTGFELPTLVVIGTDCTGICKSSRLNEYSTISIPDNIPWLCTFCKLSNS